MSSDTRSSRASPRGLRLALVVVVIVIAALARERAPSQGSAPERSAPTASTAPTTSAAADARIAELYDQRRGDVVVEVAGTVARLLPDDEEGSRHQRFIVRLASGHTLLVAHNIDLADRVPLDTGDPVGLRGEYEWNAEGGVIHWTHHDPAGRRPGGWVELGGVRYR